MAKTWQNEMNLTDRLSAGMKIKSACKIAFPQLKASEVQKKAQEIEGNAFENAASKDHYNELWRHSVSQFQVPSQHSETSQPGEPVECSTSGSQLQHIGPYTAAYHRSGLFSTIFRAQDPMSLHNSFLALKLTAPSHMAPPHNALREARLLSLAAHSHVVPLLSTFNRPGGQFILVFPFMSYTLEDLLHQNKLISAHISSHIRSLFSALAHIHSLGIIHRDVKPSNILLASASGPAYLADFGIAWKANDPDSEPADSKITDVGTTAYRPPELLFGNTCYDESLDLWAAGCVIAEIFMDGKRTLFDAGPLGSELALIQSIFKTLGTPSTETWPEAAKFPDWGKMQFYTYPPMPWTEVLPNATGNARDLVSRLIRYQSTDRLKATEVSTHVKTWDTRLVK